MPTPLRVHKIIAHDRLAEAFKASTKKGGKKLEYPFRSHVSTAIHGRQANNLSRRQVITYFEFEAAGAEPVLKTINLFHRSLRNQP